MTTPNTATNDPYPPTLDIEIDRERLESYLCRQWFLLWMIPLMFFGVFLGFTSIGPALDGGVARSEIVPIILRHVGTGIGLALLCALLGYFLISRRIARRYATSLRVSVEGAFLRIYQHTTVLTDRKLHFRAIVDYATTQDRLMRRFGIQALRMTTTAGGPASTITIPGVKDCLRVRDLLSDIDRLREN